jgi:hypothetical protein
VDPLQPYRERGALPGELRVPLPVALGVPLAIAAGVALGILLDGPEPKLVRASFFASAFAYLTVSLFDFWEHFRLEKAATGRWWSTTVLPLGETLNHAATSAVVIAFLALGRPLVSPLAPRDWFCLSAPLAFLALGWRDELVYHRKRCVHREDLMHTVAHLAAGAMMCSFGLLRFRAWP